MHLGYLRRSVLVATLGLAACGGSDAPAPSRAATPAPAAASPQGVITLAAAPAAYGDVAFLRRIEAASDGERRSARANAADPLVADLIAWIHFRDKDSDARFPEIARFIADHPGWPGLKRLRQNAERRIGPGDSPDFIIAWFGARAPLTAKGAIALIGAQIARGDRAAAAKTAKEAWTARSFDVIEENAFLARAAQFLGPRDHEARLDRLIWSRHYNEASRMLARVGPGAAAAARARIALQRTRPEGEALWSALTAEQRAKPGALYARARFLRKTDRDGEAQALLRAATRADAVGDPKDWWDERRIEARLALKARNPALAYEIVRVHGLPDGLPYMDAEFHAGWIALRFLNDPARARPHFDNLRRVAEAPISVARGAYWAGRAAEAAGNRAEALKLYQAAAQHPATYYGQLAAARAGQNEIALPATAGPSDAERRAFANEPRARAASLLAQAGHVVWPRLFLYALAKDVKSPTALALVGEKATELGYTDARVRIAKLGARKGWLVPEHGYPLIPLPAYQGFGKPPETALALGLARQESELNPRAVSHAGARGLMQLMPGTAQAVARRHGLPYSRGGLTTDPDYNATLGMAHLGELLAEFGGSYPLVLAGYNAGKGRSYEWIDQYGDPRSPNVDAVDWVELVPFSETRNYIQRVLESAQAYRARMNGGRAAIRVLQDLRRGQGY